MKSVQTSLIFVHVFKTGGTTAADWIAKHTEGLRIYTPEDPNRFREDVDGGQNLDQYDVIRGHIEMRYALKAQSRPQTIFTLVRSPEAHMMSALWHLASFSRSEIDWLNRANNEYNAGDIRSMIRPVRLYGNQLTQTWYFHMREFEFERKSWHRRRTMVNSALSGLDRAHVVGLTERMQDSLRLLSWRMSWPAPREIGTVRRTGAGEQPMPLILRWLLRYQLHLDRKLYEHAVRKFNLDMDGLRQAASGHATIDDFLDARALKSEPVPERQ